MSRQSGFSLIELMIVVAIMGILAAIAIPNYKTYTTRARVSEGLTLAGSAKTAVVEYWLSESSTFPTEGSPLDNNRVVGLSDPTDITGKFVTSVGIEDGGTIVVTYSAVDTNLSGKTITMIPVPSDGSVSWNCESPAGSQIDNQFLPAVCRI